MSQPYGNFAKALLEPQKYPNLLDEKGNPIPPYDVTAHTLTLLMNVKAYPIVQSYRSWFAREGGDGGSGFGSGRLSSVMVYRSYIPAIDEGWTRWFLETSKKTAEFTPISTSNKDIRGEDFLFERFENPPERNKPKSYEISLKAKVLIFPDQPPAQILNGYAKGSMPDEYVGGVGKEGVENLKKFVEAGGTLVFLNRSSDFAIDQFDLPIKDVTKGLARKDFYIPGSILRTELDTTSPIAKGMPKESIAWFEGGPAFELSEPPASVGGQNAGANWPPANAGGSDRSVRVQIIARYPTDPKAILLSGWALGAEKIAGKAALVEVKIGKGKIILFGFRPQYRGQSLATFPLLFNAISQ
jgi:hypothetical protein